MLDDAFRLQSEFGITNGMPHIFAFGDTLPLRLDGRGDVAVSLALEELGDAVGIVMVVVVSTLLQVILVGVDVGCGLLSAQVAQSNKLLLLKVLQLLGRQSQLLVHCPAFGARLSVGGRLGQNGVYLDEGLAAKSGSD